MSQADTREILSARQTDLAKGVKAYRTACTDLIDAGQQLYIAGRVMGCIAAGIGQHPTPAATASLEAATAFRVAKERQYEETLRRHDAAQAAIQSARLAIVQAKDALRAQVA